MTTTDKPRKMLVLHPSEVMGWQRRLVDEGITDVLVKGDSIVEPGQGYVLDMGLLEAPFATPDLSADDSAKSASSVHEGEQPS